jgi:hypothetical protein
VDSYAHTRVALQAFDKREVGLLEVALKYKFKIADGLVGVNQQD